MNRKTFIKRIALVAAGLPLLSKAGISRSSNKLKIYEGELRGIPYYDYYHLVEQLPEKADVACRREPENPYDEFAIAIYYMGSKLGFLPAKENQVPARMMDAGVPLSAKLLTQYPGMPVVELHLVVDDNFISSHSDYKQTSQTL